MLKELGSHREAAACYERVIALKPSAEAHYNLANAQAKLGQLSEAVASYQRALALKPDLVGAHNNLANALVAHGRSDEALIHFQRALEVDPNLVEAHVNLGTILLQQGKLDAAAAQFERALGIDANSADAQANLGNVRLAQGRLVAAEQCYRRALELKPDAAEVDNNLGLVLTARGDFEEAGRRFQRALVRQPDSIDAHNNLARLFLSMGQAGNALDVVGRALAIGETAQSKSLFVQCLRVLPDPPDVDELRPLLIRALSESWGRANDLAAAAARMVKRDGAIAPSVTRVLDAWPGRVPAHELLEPAALAAISGDRLLRQLMQSAPIVDIELERLLTAIRLALLEIACASGDASVTDERLASAETLNFCCALARQCFLNEQVFACTDDELEEARRLRDRVVAASASGAADCGHPVGGGRGVFSAAFASRRRVAPGQDLVRCDRGCRRATGARARRGAGIARVDPRADAGGKRHIAEGSATVRRKSLSALGAGGSAGRAAALRSISAPAIARRRLSERRQA